MRDAVLQKRTNNAVATKSKPSLEIYRPPGKSFCKLHYFFLNWFTSFVNWFWFFFVRSSDRRGYECYKSSTECSRKGIHNETKWNPFVKVSVYENLETKCYKQFFIFCCFFRSQQIDRGYYLQHSKSSGNIHRYMYNQHPHMQHQYPMQHQISYNNIPHQANYHPIIDNHMRTPYLLNTSASSGNILHVRIFHFPNRHHFLDIKFCIKCLIIFVKKILVQFLLFAFVCRPSTECTLAKMRAMASQVIQNLESSRNRCLLFCHMHWRDQKV